MKRRTLLALTLVALTFVVTSSAYAQATRTWISGVGSDSNPCSRTAPCKTWAFAIASTAAGGEIDALDPGGFGGLTITKSITLDGGGGQVASVLVSGTNGINVAAGSNDVVILRNVRFDGLLGNGTGAGGTPGINGISFTSGAALVIENCEIFGFGTWGINYVNSSPTSTLSVVNTVVANNGVGATGGGILIQPPSSTTAKASITGVKVVNNVVGIKGSGDNSALKTLITIDNSRSFGSPHSGIVAETANGPVTIMLTAVDSSNNNVGVQGNGAGALVTVGGSTISGNTTGVLVQNSGQVLSYKNNQINGNTTDGTPIPAVSGTGGLN